MPLQKREEKETKYNLQSDEVTKLQHYKRTTSFIEEIRSTMKFQLKKVGDFRYSFCQQKRTVHVGTNGNGNDGNHSSIFLLLLDLIRNKSELIEINVPHYGTDVTVNSILNCIPFGSKSSLGKAKYRGLVDLKRVDIKINLEENVTLKAGDIFVPIPLDNDIDECVHASHFIMNCSEVMLKLAGYNIPAKCPSNSFSEVMKVGKIDWNKLLVLGEDETYTSSYDESFSGTLSETLSFKDSREKEVSQGINSVNEVKDSETDIGLNLKCDDLGDGIGWGNHLI